MALRADAGAEADRQHAELFVEKRFPSAAECGTCHQRHYREWSVSGHAYAQVSPIFNAMQGTLVRLTNGTLGDFCIRCHTPVGMALGEPVFTSNENRHPVSVEGVTCIVCHRVDRAYGKVSSRFPLVEGELFEPIYGPRDGSELERVLADGETYKKLVVEPGKAGRKVHREARSFFQTTTPGFCGRCHDVRFIDGFRLEDAFSEYKQSPAAHDGTSCQDCHMGKVAGLPQGYEIAPAAVIGGASTTPAKHTNHMLTGPDYPVVHPGIFPHNPDAQELATNAEWIQFDYAAGWGTDEFEDEIGDEAVFPQRWEWADDRYDAREVLDEQLALLAEGFARSTELLKNGYALGELIVRASTLDELAFDVELRNKTRGHNVPTGFSSERLVFLRVSVEDPAGQVVFRSGDLDPNGDLRDLHSLYVRAGRRPLDESLLCLQSHFVTRNLRGSEAENVIPVNTSLDPLPFARPATLPSILTGTTPAARIHKRSIEPEGSLFGQYRLDSDLSEGEYTVRVELVAGMLPINLVHAVKDVGFDYGLSERAIAEAVVAGHRVLDQKVVRIEVKPR